MNLIVKIWNIKEETLSLRQIFERQQFFKNKFFIMKKILSLMCAVAAILCMTSCGKKLEPLTADNFTCNPSPLVEVGGKVEATITVTYPEKYFKKKAILTVTPVLVYASGETASEPVTFQGEKIYGNDNTISYKYGGNATFKASFDYKDEMANSKLYLDFKAETKSGKVYTLPRIAIADGVIATESLATGYGATPAYSSDNFVKDTFDKYIANLIYQKNSSNLRSSETKKAEMQEVEAMIKATKDEERREFEGIEMVSTASPEGAYTLNERLADKRESASTKYLQKMLKKAKMEGQITPEQVAENWEGFKELVEQSNLQDKALVLNVLARISDPEQREQEIRNLSAAYKELADDILPQLRYSKVTATVKNIGHTDDEILLWSTATLRLSLSRSSSMLPTSLRRTARRSRFSRLQTRTSHRISVQRTTLPTSVIRKASMLRLPASGKNSPRRILQCQRLISTSVSSHSTRATLTKLLLTSARQELALSMARLWVPSSQTRVTTLLLATTLERQRPTMQL